MNLNDVLRLMSDFNLSTDELLVTYLLFLCQREENEGLGHTNLFLFWYRMEGEEKLHTIFESLKKKKIIKADCQPTTPADVEFTNVFVNKFLRHSDILGQELWSVYPEFKISNGVKYDWKNIAGRNSKFNDLSEFFFFYAKEIGNSIEKHDEIIDLIKWAKENNKICWSIREFVISHKWEQLKALKENPYEGEIVDSVMLYD